MSLKRWNQGTVRHLWASAYVWSAGLPGEAEEDIDDGHCQVHTLLPVLPQNSGQGSKDRLCRHKNIKKRVMNEGPQKKKTKCKASVCGIQSESDWTVQPEVSFKEAWGNAMRSEAPEDFVLRGFCQRKKNDARPRARLLFPRRPQASRFTRTLGSYQQRAGWCGAPDGVSGRRVVTDTNGAVPSHRGRGGWRLLAVAEETARLSRKGAELKPSVVFLWEAGAERTGSTLERYSFYQNSPLIQIWLLALRVLEYEWGFALLNCNDWLHLAGKKKIIYRKLIQSE